MVHYQVLGRSSLAQIFQYFCRISTPKFHMIEHALISCISPQRIHVTIQTCDANQKSSGFFGCAIACIKVKHLTLQFLSFCGQKIWRLSGGIHFLMYQSCKPSLTVSTLVEPVDYVLLRHSYVYLVGAQPYYLTVILN